MLRHAYEHVDHISVHAYYEQHGDDRDSFLASALHLDDYIEAIVATADHIRAAGRHRRRMQLSVDEWNVWYQRDLRVPADWVDVGPRIAEDTFSVTDAVVVGSLLISLLRHGDRVTAACISELVNTMAPIRTEPHGPAWRQTTFEVDLRGLPGARLAGHLLLADDDPDARNTADAPDRAVPRAGTGSLVDGGRLTAVLPPLSWNVIRLDLASGGHGDR